MGLAACGSSGRATRPAADAAGQRSSAFRGDGDFDRGDKDDDNSWDDDKDAAFDYFDRKSYSWNRGVFHDRDDAEQVAFGKSADSADAQTISRIVERYWPAPVSSVRCL